jgi:hypothetical protein
MSNSPCEYCGTALPLGVDKRTRRIRSAHFASCVMRPKRMEVENEAPRLADAFDAQPAKTVKLDMMYFEAAAGLRRLYAVNQELLEALKRISATKNLARELEAEWCPAATGMVRMARTAIAKAEGKEP